VEPLSDLLEPLRRAFGGNSAELAKLLSGDLAMWQAAAEGSPRQSFCFYIGITDASQVKELIKSLKLRATETEGICTLASSQGVAWSVQSNALLIASDRACLKASLPAGAPSLTDTPDFQVFLKKMPGNYAGLKYATYEQGLSVRNAEKLPAPLKPVLELFKGCREMQVSRAENGWLESQSVQHFPAGWPAVRDVLKAAFSAGWTAEKPAAPVPPPLTLSADEVWQKSIDLLSDGRQSDAEKLIDQAVQQYSDEARILFAKAVLERSRWFIDEANRCFAQLVKRFPDTDWAQAARLSLELDRHEAVEADLAALIQLAETSPDNIYLLWLSAIQCREQNNGILGRRQYEKLLSKFRVGPVLLHQTYANILEENLMDYETALKHRYLAVSMEAKHWSMRGLADTLVKLKRCDEACAVLARTVQLEPS
ncbi:MAG TPA: hypothetical protein PKI68_08550, partial [Pontiellaceae bacterium]|nr:hypothetical protein [Pontiellaceae bacterium]